MNKNKRYLLVYLVVAILAINYFAIGEAETPELNINSNNRYGAGFRYNIQGWVYLHIEGEPYERGYQYGYLAHNEIIDMMYRWGNLGHDSNFMKIFIIKNLKRDYDEISQKWWNICRSESMKKFINQVPEEYQEEMKGMTAGLKDRGANLFGREIEFEDVVASQFVQEVQYTISKLHKGIHPVRSFFNGLADLLTGDILKHNGHCNVFIATGDATKDGGIVVAHETIFSPYIAERCNFVVDIKPSEGNRFIMTCPPGSLWSQEDWYQNEKGIVLTETEMIPQGPWRIRGNLPKGVRSRTAIQYSENIDEVIKNLENGNNGLIPNEWIIGNTKTGEIASYQQALYNTPIKRTFNGYYQSNNLPHNINVLSELTGVPKILLRIYPKIFSKKALFEIEDEKVIWKEEVYQKLNEMGEKHYGNIDEEVVKEIMSTYPITKRTTDCKITSSQLMSDLGVILHMGIPDGEEWNPDEKMKETLKGVTSLPSAGWLEMYPSEGKTEFQEYKNEKSEPVKTSKVLWSYELEEEYVKTSLSSCRVAQDSLYLITDKDKAYEIDKKTGKKKGIISMDELESEINQNEFVLTSIYGKKVFGFHPDNNEKLWDFEADAKVAALPALKENMACFGSWNGKVHSINSRTGQEKWNFETGWGVVAKPAITDKSVFFGSLDSVFYAIDKNSGEKQWSFTCKAAIQSSPAVYGEYVFFGCDDGILYALEQDTGKLGWKFKPKYSIEDNIVQNYLTTPITSDPIVDNGVVYLSVDDTLYALDAQTIESAIYNEIEKIDSQEYLIPVIAIGFLIILVLLIIFIRKYKK